MSIALWPLGLILGLAVLFVVFQVSGANDARPGQRPSRWLLVFSALMLAVGLFLIVVAARSGG
jgi:purine-cytosine permease-like protein